MSCLNKLRDFIATFPRWEEHGIMLMNDKIAAEYFKSPDKVTQLALRLDGSRIVKKQRDLLDIATIERRNSYTLLVLKSSGTSAERADTSAFFDDFIEWFDEADVRGNVPQFGDDPISQMVDVEVGGVLAPWDNGQAMIYGVRIHINYTKYYESEELY